MVLAENSLQIFGFKGVVCKIFRDKELAVVANSRSVFAWTSLRKVLIPEGSSLQSINE
jgi:hypothetical protein